MRLNWTFKIVCVDCGTVLIVKSVNPSRECLENDARLAVLTIPNECPDCHNLHVVTAKENT